MYAGIALLLGGCVLSVIFATVINNPTVLGLTFLCTVPIGLILFVVGLFQMVMRREGRMPK